MKHPSPIEAQQAQRRGDERQQEHGGKRVVFWTRLISAADAQRKVGGRVFEAFLSTLGGPEKAAVSYSVFGSSPNPSTRTTPSPVFGLGERTP